MVAGLLIGGANRTFLCVCGGPNLFETFVVNCIQRKTNYEESSCIFCGRGGPRNGTT